MSTQQVEKRELNQVENRREIGGKPDGKAGRKRKGKRGGKRWRWMAWQVGKPINAHTTIGRDVIVGPKYRYIE